MAAGGLFSSAAAGGIGSSALKSLVLPKALCSSARSPVGEVGRFAGGRRSAGSRFPASSFQGMREFSGRRGSARIFVERCKAQRKDEVPDTMNITRFQQAALWSAEAAYILWLFLLPYAPGDPVWAISPATVNELVCLSLNFFFILPITNSVGIHLLESPVIHPVSEGLFNFVLGWTLMFAPLLFTDSRKDRCEGSLDILWGLQMFLTNTFLIPYMAIRLNATSAVDSPREPNIVVASLTRAAAATAVTGGAVCLFSLFWAAFGRQGAGFGGLNERVEFFWRYVGSERLAYAFVFDVLLYSIFQPWLIGENMKNLKEEFIDSVKILRFVPVLGLIAYLLGLRDDKKL